MVPLALLGSVSIDPFFQLPLAPTGAQLPSSLIINKHLDTSDTWLVTLEQDLVNNPLEQSLGFVEFGKYVRAAPEELEQGSVKLFFIIVLLLHFQFENSSF